MHGMKALLGEDCMGTLGINWYSSYSSANWEQRSQSVLGGHGDILNISPRLSHHNPTIHLERRLHGRKSLCCLEMASGSSSTNSMASTEIQLKKPALELVKEIAALELEVSHLERYLLSLYRTAFNQYLASSLTSTDHASRYPLESHGGSLVQDTKLQIEHQEINAVNSELMDEQVNQSLSLEKIEINKTIDHRDIEDLTAGYMAAGLDDTCGPSRREEDPKNDMLKCNSGRRSLADHLGASISDHVPETPCNLSEDIVRCISSIYCKLGNQPTETIDLLASPTPSVSSSSTFSPQEPCDNWSPQCHYEATASLSRFNSSKRKQSPYSSMIEVPKISVDGDKFAYASMMLNNFRSLIRRLETMDPRKMEHEGQLAFWINIHNALVMHAFLAYGLHQHSMKSTFSILKAAYDVGGHSINAYVIQSSILGCQPHRPPLWLRTLLSPAVKLVKGTGTHPYALDRPEPLTHFTLCLGAYSDPAVRVYTAKGIPQELNLAKEEFIQANVSIKKETKIVLPKILYYYSKDASLELPNLLEMVSNCMPKTQQKAIQGCLRRKLDKCVEWEPYKPAFRYLVHKDLAKH